MFNNLLNIQDIDAILRRGPKIFLKLVSEIHRGRQKRAKAAWAHSDNPPNNWWDIPAVKSRWNYLISGNAQIDYYEYISQNYLAEKNSLFALSLGCGTGHRELRWAETGKFKCINAYDFSEQRIEQATRNAAQKGLSDIVNYHVADVFKIEMCENYYDIILAEQSLHHFSPLKKLIPKVQKFLKPGGYFILNEFVGPTRFQWTDRQIEIINGLLAVFPHKYKALWGTNCTKSKIYKPSRLRMIMTDPSEAVESSKIVPLLYKFFNVVEFKEYGGTILHMLFNGIAHNFLSQNLETKLLLKICFEVEDILLNNNEIQSDFIVAICEKNTNHYCPQ